MSNIGYIQLVRVCNQKCRFCSNPETGAVLPYDTAVKYIDKYREMKYEGVVFTGGEPTLHEDLSHLIAYALSAKIHPRIITNGQLTADLSFLSKLRDAGLNHMHVSVQSHIPDIQNGLSQNNVSLSNILLTIENANKLGINVDINMCIMKQNVGALDLSVRWLCERFPFLHHFSFTNLDPTASRVAENPDVVHQLWELEISLFKTLHYLRKTNRTFRVEKVPLCYMADFADSATETRKIVLREERGVQFLDDKQFVHTSFWYYTKTETCMSCRLEPICAGLWGIYSHYSPEALYPVFFDPEPIARRIRHSH